MENTYFGIKEAARRCGVTQATMRNWEKKPNSVKPDRSPTNRRRYTEQMIADMMKAK